MAGGAGRPVVCVAGLTLSEGEKEGQLGGNVLGRAVWKAWLGVLAPELPVRRDLSLPGLALPECPCLALPLAGSIQGQAWHKGGAGFQRAGGGTVGQLCSLLLDVREAHCHSHHTTLGLFIPKVWLPL